MTPSQEIQAMIAENNALLADQLHPYQLTVHWRPTSEPQSVALTQTISALTQTQWLDDTRDGAGAVVRWLDSADPYVQEVIGDTAGVPNIGALPRQRPNAADLIARLQSLIGSAQGGNASANMVRSLDELIASLKATGIVASVAGGLVTLTTEAGSGDAVLGQRFDRWNDLPEVAEIVKRLIKTGAESRVDLGSADPRSNDASLQWLIRFEYVQRGNELQYQQMSQLRGYLTASDDTLAVMNKFQDILMGKEAEKAQLDLRALWELGQIKNGGLDRTEPTGVSHWIDYDGDNRGAVRDHGEIQYLPDGTSTSPENLVNEAINEADNGGRDPEGYITKLRAWEAKQFENRELRPITGRGTLGFIDPAARTGSPTITVPNPNAPPATIVVPNVDHIARPGTVLSRYLNAFGRDNINAVTGGIQDGSGTTLYDAIRTQVGGDLAGTNRLGLLLKNHIQSRIQRTQANVQLILDNATNNREEPDLINNLTELRERLKNLLAKFDLLPTNANIFDIIKDLKKGGASQTQAAQDTVTIGLGDNLLNGAFQQALDQVYSQANAAKDSFNEELRRRMFEFEEFYKSAGAIIDRIHQILLKFAGNVAR